MTGRYGNLDYSTFTKGGFLVGVVLFAVGAVGALGAHAIGLQLPAWEASLLWDAEVVGILLALLTPLVFGILLPLTE
ncbi:MAG: hypothetical protein ABEJ82_01865 [Haloplanus sp.]